MTQMNVLGGGPARAVPPDLFAIPTRGLRENFAAFKAVAPPVTKADIIPLTMGEGFVADYMRPTYAQKQRTQLCNEFQRPLGLHHEVAAFLDEGPAGTLRFLAFRDARQGRFEADELQVFARTLPYLRSAVMVSRAALQAMARRQAEPFERRGEPVLYLDVDGRLAEANAAAEQVLGRHVTAVRRRLATSWPQDQARLDRALTAALVEGRPGLVTLRGVEGLAPVMALVLPVSGDAKDVYHSTAAFVVLIDPARRQDVDDAAIGLLNQAAGLTAREVDVVRLVGMGQSPRDAADELGIGYGTLRTHLKAGFAKLGVHSQRELVSLIQRLR